jgi:hypothetical protein
VATLAVEGAEKSRMDLSPMVEGSDRRERKKEKLTRITKNSLVGKFSLIN